MKRAYKELREEMKVAEAFIHDQQTEVLVWMVDVLLDELSTREAEVNKIIIDKA